MDDVDVLSTVTLYLRGDRLDPDLVTEVLGTRPTTARRKGDEWFHSEEGFEGSYSQPTGLWALEFGENSPSGGIAELSTLLSQRSADIGEIEGVEVVPGPPVWRTR